jgi:hypothetical protein
MQEDSREWRERFEARLALRLLLRSVRFELVCGVVAISWLWSFVGKHAGEMRFIVAAGVLHAAAVLSMVASVWQLVSFARAGEGDTGPELERKLVRVSQMRDRITGWTLRLAPLLWVPLAVVGAEAWLGLDLCAALGPRWLAANLVGSLALAGVLTLTTRRAAARRA